MKRATWDTMNMKCKTDHGHRHVWIMNCEMTNETTTHWQVRNLTWEMKYNEWSISNGKYQGRHDTWEMKSDTCNEKWDHP